MRPSAALAAILVMFISLAASPAPAGEGPAPGAPADVTGDADVTGTRNKDTLTVIYPNGGEVIHGEVRILWNTGGTTTDMVNLNLIYTDKFGPPGTITIENGVENTGSYLWQTDDPMYMDRDDYTLGIQSRDIPDMGDTSDGNFTLKNSPDVDIRFSPPRGVVVQGKSYTVRWDATDPNGNSDALSISIQYSDRELEGGNRAWDPVVTGLNNTVRKYTWDTSTYAFPANETDSAVIRLSAMDDENHLGVSESDVFRVSRTEPREEDEAEGGDGLAEFAVKYWPALAVLAFFGLIGLGLYLRKAQERRSIEELRRRRREERETPTRERRSGRRKGRRRRAKGRGR